MSRDPSPFVLGDDDDEPISATPQTVPGPGPGQGPVQQQSSSLPAADSETPSTPPLNLPASSLLDAVRQIQENQADIAEAQQLLQDLLLRSTSLLQAQKLLEQHAVLATLSSAGHQLGCHQGRPVAALLVHRCLLHWNTFEAGPEGALLLEQLLAVMAAQGTEEEQQDDGSQGGERQLGAALPGLERVAYWLASAATLLALVTRLAPNHPPLPPSTLHPHPHHDPSASALTKISEIQRKISNTFKAGWAKGLFSKAPLNADEGAPAAGDDVDAHSAAPPPPPPPHEALRDPVDAFRRRLSLLTLQLYGVLRDAFRRQLAGLLPGCVQRAGGLGSPLVQSPRTDCPQLLLPGDGSAGSSLEAGPGPEGGPGLGAGSVLRPWADLVSLLSDGLQVLLEQGVPSIIIKCLIKQVLGFVDVQLFNQLLLRPECCSASNAQYMSEGLSYLDAWLAGQGQGSSKETAYLTALRTSMRHTRQALTFLVHPDKANLSLEDITRCCSSLSLQQLYRLCTTFWDDLPPQLTPKLPSSQQPPQTPGAHLTAQEAPAPTARLGAEAAAGQGAGGGGSFEQPWGGCGGWQGGGRGRGGWDEPRWP